MLGDYLTIAEVSERLGIKPRRVRALIDDGQLPAAKVGTQHVVALEDVRLFEHIRMPRQGGPTLSPLIAWSRIADVMEGDLAVRDRRSLDRFRRSVRSRADHRRYYVHPGVLDSIQSLPVVLTGRRAAEQAGIPVEPDETYGAYVRSSDLPTIETRLRARPVLTGGDAFNLELHVVDDDVWPFADSAASVPLWVAWLDLEDAQDRAAETTLDRLTGGRVLG